MKQMKFLIPPTQNNIQTMMRDAGYRPEGQDQRSGELKFTKSITGAPYPHFHIYCKEQGENISCNLHLDQKKPSYSGSSAHSGEYDGALVETEVERITRLLS